MFDFATLLVSKAFAADAVAPVVAPVVADAAAGMADNPNPLMRFLPLFLIFGVFYVFLIRPQQKKMERQAQLVKGLKRGDKVVTAGGVVGTISKIDGDLFLIVEIAKGVEIKVVKSTVSGMPDDIQTANENKSK